MSPKIDPITRSVVQHRLGSIVTEMGEAMLRTSYSQILNSSRDFSLAITDTGGRLIAQAEHIPVHVGALPWATRAVEERFKDIAPGDVILLNDPYHGGSHLPDLTAALHCGVAIPKVGQSRSREYRLKLIFELVEIYAHIQLKKKTLGSPASWLQQPGAIE